MPVSAYCDVGGALDQTVIEVCRPWLQITMIDKQSCDVQMITWPASIFESCIAHWRWCLIKRVIQVSDTLSGSAITSQGRRPGSREAGLIATTHIMNPKTDVDGSVLNVIESWALIRPLLHHHKLLAQVVQALAASIEVVAVFADPGA